MKTLLRIACIVVLLHASFALHAQSIIVYAAIMQDTVAASISNSSAERKAKATALALSSKKGGKP
ncbi:MAG: hypothetical protein LBF67_00040 [Prevotellaceae bacterium]|jgi:hypothetical protein|nr:hypothetical protein [Prevotellaceae bacterium]